MRIQGGPSPNTRQRCIVLVLTLRYVESSCSSKYSSAFTAPPPTNNTGGARARKRTRSVRQRSMVANESRGREFRLEFVNARDDRAHRAQIIRIFHVSHGTHVRCERIAQDSPCGPQPASVQIPQEGFLESVRRVYAGLHSFLNISLMEARRRKASALRLRFSQSLASLRHRPSQAKVRSTTHRLGRTTKAFA